MQNDIVVRYEDMDFYYCTNHYDVHWEGYCIHNGKLAKYRTRDLTDYQKMNDTCPSCGPEDKSYEHCHCQSYVDVVCHIEELTLTERIKAWLHIHIGLKVWYVKNWGWTGVYYWKNWYNR